MLGYILNPEVEKYLKSLPQERDTVLEEMEEYAGKNNFPIIGREGGRVLHLITKIKNPRLIVEIGSGFGYSAYWFAKASEKGKVVLTDYQEKNINLAKRFFEKGGIENKAKFRVGDGIEIGKEYKNIDILFLDLEKARYLEAIKELENNISENGIVIADNVLLQGKVILEPESRKSKIIREFNEYMFKKFFSVIIPIRDGILIACKKS
ncbi:O-methyltransferase [Persephonella sp.]